MARWPTLPAQPRLPLHPLACTSHFPVEDGASVALDIRPVETMASPSCEDGADLSRGFGSASVNCRGSRPGQCLAVETSALSGRTLVGMSRGHLVKSDLRGRHPVPHDCLNVARVSADYAWAWRPFNCRVRQLSLGICTFCQRWASRARQRGGRSGICGQMRHPWAVLPLSWGFCLSCGKWRLFTAREAIVDCLRWGAFIRTLYMKRASSPSTGPVL